MTKPLISVLLPSRDRPELFAESVRSLMMPNEGDSKRDDIEICARFDLDDPTLGRYGRDGVRSCIGASLGYRGLHTYYNEAAAIAQGDWLMLWNDDCLMETANWPVSIRASDPDQHWMLLDHGHFPVVHRRWLEATGRISASPHADSFLTEVAGIVEKTIPGIVKIYRAKESGEPRDGWQIHHRADELDDAGSARRKAEVLGPQGTSALFFTPAMRVEIERDAELVIAALREQGIA